MATNVEVGAAFTLVVAVGFLLFQAGRNSAAEEFPEVFQPDFGTDSTADDKCFLIAARQDERIVYSGCKTEQALRDMHKRWRKAGLSWPYRVVAEFDRELDG